MVDHVGDLDRHLEEAGEDVVLQRNNVNVTIRAVVRLRDKPDQLVSGAKQDDLNVVTSMTKIRAAGWQPGTTGVAPFVTENAIPRRNDVLFIKGRRYLVEASDPIAVRNAIVRVNLLIKGNTSGA